MFLWSFKKAIEFVKCQKTYNAACCNVCIFKKSGMIFYLKKA